MTRPQIIFDVVSNALGNVPVSPANTIAIYGVASAGPINEPSDPYSVPGNVAVDFGYGPGPELAANLVASGIRTIFTRVETDTVGTVSSVTFSGTGTCVLSISGDPFQAYDISVVVSKAGTAGSEPEPSFQVSFDGGRTYSRSIRMPANRIYSGFADFTGLTLNFTAGTMVVGDEYTATSTDPVFVAAGVVDALAAFRTSKSQAALHFTTGALDESGVTECLTQTNSFIDQKKFCRFVFEARDIASGETAAQWMDSISADFAAFTDNRISVAAGAARITSALTGFRLRKNILWLAAVRAGQVSARTQGPTFGQDLGATEDGPLVSFTQNGQGSAVTEVYYDEQLTPGLDEARFITVTSYPGDEQNGYYICNPNIMSGPTSDFNLLQLGRVMDEACRVTNGFFIKQISKAVRVNPRTGRILEIDAKALDSGNNQVIANAIIANGNASPLPNDQYTTVSRVDNILNTQAVSVSVKILPLGYLKEITITMSFFNPALSSAA